MDKSQNKDVERSEEPHTLGITHNDHFDPPLVISSLHIQSKERQIICHLPLGLNPAIIVTKIFETEEIVILPRYIALLYSLEVPSFIYPPLGPYC